MSDETSRLSGETSRARDEPASARRETSARHGETSGNGLDTLREFSGGQRLFGRYTLIKTLGRGGMGVVWLARDEVLEREVALKFLPDLVVHDRAVLSDLKRETRRSLELTHKNIVRIHDFVHDGQSGCISMEYVDGDTLSNLRADKPRKVFEIPELTDWTSELCDALDYAHNHARIIHRDLKPANLMVNQRGDLKVTDFGIARSLSDSMSKVTMQHGKSGTLVYMSPQQLDGERGSHLDDIYSFGACLYELLTGRPPFSSGNVDRQIREKIPPSMTQRRKELEIEGDRIDESWERVVASCLAKDPGAPAAIDRQHCRPSRTGHTEDENAQGAAASKDASAELQHRRGCRRRSLPPGRQHLVFWFPSFGAQACADDNRYRGTGQGEHIGSGTSDPAWRSDRDYLTGGCGCHAGRHIYGEKSGHIQRSSGRQVPDANNLERLRDH